MPIPLAQCDPPQVRLPQLSVVVFCALSVLACKASVKGEASVKAGEEIPEYDQPLPAAPSAEASGFGDSNAGTLDKYALVGARTDLSLAKTPSQPNCRCLAAAAGPANDPAFAWKSAPPTLDRATQLVVAFSSTGVDCPVGGPKGLGASYWGYEIQGKDLVVFVEPAQPGRPLTQGAIVPRPQDGGRIWLKPMGKGVPYGRALDGQRQCELPAPKL